MKDVAEAAGVSVDNVVVIEVRIENGVLVIEMEVSTEVRFVPPLRPPFRSKPPLSPSASFPLSVRFLRPFLACLS